MTPAWKIALKNAITDPLELLQLLDLDLENLPDHLKGALLFPLRVPRSFVSRMEKGNPNDPLLLQALPLGIEALEVAGFTADPLDEINHNPLPGLLHKYKGRVLVVSTGACAIHCRYCFRRNFPYEDNQPGADWRKILDYIANDPSIHEVILSGGDPLTQTDSSLQRILTQLTKIPHLETLRFHSRIPVVLPERLDPNFFKLFEHFSLNKVMVLHVNHPNELNETVHRGLTALKERGFTLLNQAVLLKGINHSLDIQIALQKKLFSQGVLPYYLHMLDHARGTAHFEVSLKEAKALQKALQNSLPGYLVPRFATEIPGEGSKTLV